MGNFICKGHNLERSKSLVQMKGTIEFLDHKKHRPRHLKIMQSGLVQSYDKTRSTQRAQTSVAEADQWEVSREL